MVGGVPPTPTVGPRAAPPDGGITGLHPAVGVTSAPGGVVLSITETSDQEAIRSVFEACGPRIAGVVTEVPTNPSVRCGDLLLLRKLCDECGAALVLDPTMCSAFCAGVSGLADATVLSLTKYFGSGASVMAGALAVNPERKIGAMLMPPAPGGGKVDGSGSSGGSGDDTKSGAAGSAHVPQPEPISAADLAAVVRGAADVPQVLPAMLRNTQQVAKAAEAFLTESADGAGAGAGAGDSAETSARSGERSLLSEVDWALSPACLPSLEPWLRDPGEAVRGAFGSVGIDLSGHPMVGTGAAPLPPVGCIVSLGFRSESALRGAYDGLRFVKGPSFGTSFSLACPFVFLAHYDMASTEDGRRALRNHGINPFVLRLSVGAEGGGAPGRHVKELLEAVRREETKGEEAERGRGSLT